jgi:hypothetical protein
MADISDPVTGISFDPFVGTALQANQLRAYCKVLSGAHKRELA